MGTDQIRPNVSDADLGGKKRWWLQRTPINMAANGKLPGSEPAPPVSEVRRLSLSVPVDDGLPTSRKASFFIGEHEQIPVTIIGPDNEEISPDDIVVPPDGGWGWVIVFAAFMCNVIVDGTIFSFGIVLVAIVESAAASGNPVSISTVSWVGGSLTGFYLLAGPFVSSLANKFGFRTTAIIGSAVGFLGLAGAWFFCRDGTPNLLALFVMYGVIGGIGFGLIYVPAVITVGFYFEKKRALATGIAICGSGIGTFVYAPLVEFLIKTFEWQGAVLFQAGIVACCAIFGSLYRPLKPNKKYEKNRNFRRDSTQGPSPALTPLLLRIKRARDMEKWDSVNSFASTEAFDKQRLSNAGDSAEAYKARANQLYESARKSSSASLGSAQPRRLSIPNMLGAVVSFQQPNDPVPEKTPQRSNSARNKSFIGIPPSLKEIEEEHEHEHEESEGQEKNATESLTENNNAAKLEVDAGKLSGSTKNFRLLSSTNLAGGEPTGAGRKNSIPAITLVLSSNALDIPDARVFRVSSKSSLNKKPMHREDIFYSGSLMRIPEYANSTSNVADMYPSVEWQAEPVPASLEEIPEVEHKPRKWTDKLGFLKKMLDFSLLKSITFLLLSVAGGITMLGFFVPFMYLKAIGTEHSLDDSQATLLISIIGMANTVGRIICGGVADKLSSNVLIINNAALTVGGLATIFVPFLNSYPLYILYACLFGLSIACFASLRSILIVNLLGLNKLTNAFGLLLLFQGLAAFVGSPLAGFLRDATGDYNTSFYVAGSLILISGLMCYPINMINRWECQRQRRKESSA